MGFLTKLIALAMVFVFLNNLDVYCSMERRIHSVEVKLNNLETRVKTKSDEAKSDIATLEGYISSLKSSANASNDGSCSLSEEKSRVKKTMKQTKDELSALEREKIAVTSEIKREKKWLKQKIRSWQKAVDALSSQMDSLQIKEGNLKRNFQIYDDMTKYITFGECKYSNQNMGTTREMSEDFAFINETISNKYLTRQPCLDGWFLFNMHCYHYVKGYARTFSSARDYCRQSNAYVADVESRSESKFIYGLTGNVGTWIGVTDKEKENVWISERTKQVVTYTNWLRGDPDGGTTQNCVILGYRPSRYHKWIDAPCRSEYHCVCKKEAIPVK